MIFVIKADLIMPDYIFNRVKLSLAMNFDF